MKINKRIIFILAGLLLAGFIAYRYLRPFNKNTKPSADKVTAYVTQPVLAVFNRHDSTTGKDSFNHFLLQLIGTDAGDISSNLSLLGQNSQPALITIETLPSGRDNDQKENVLEQIINGDFDDKIKQLCSVLAGKKNEQLVTINPDMEVYVNLFPWQKQAPDLYIKSFRHFAEMIRKYAPGVKVAWSPAGYPGADEYWPGADFVDWITVSLRSRSEMMTTNYPEPPTSQIMFEHKIERMRLFDKPMIFVGSEKFADKDFKKTEFKAAVNTIKENEAILFLDAGVADTKIPDSVLRKGSPAIGLYDPRKALVNVKGVTSEHLFVNLERLSNGAFAANFNAAIARNHDVIVTMEPWKAKNLQKDSNLLANILSGKYDAQFLHLFDILKNQTTQKVYLRFLHEMEIPITRYPWQSQDPVKYIKAFRHFVKLLQHKPANIYMVWGPAGDRGSMEFWPGSDVVDYVSIAIYGLPDKNITDHTKQESFSAIFKRKYRRIAGSHKPLFITEFGVKGPEDYKREWMMAAASTINSEPAITGINYFNFEDSPKAWGNIKTPDWSTSRAVFLDFVKEISRN